MARLPLGLLTIALLSACSGSDDSQLPFDAGPRSVAGNADAAMHSEDVSDAKVTSPVRTDGGAIPLLDAAASDPVGADTQDAASDEGRSFDGEGDPWLKAAPRAKCASGDQPDPGTQGLSGDLRCNVEVAGKVAAPYFLSMAWYKECAYVNGSDGTTVVDVSDSANPRIATTLMTAGMRSNWESMKVHQERGVLVGYESIGPVMDVYDVSGDCKAPTLKSSFAVGGIGHAGNFAPDGTIYYASSLFTSELFAVDITQLDKPAIISSTFTGMDGAAIGTHDLSIAKGGTRAYLTYTSLLQLGGSLAIVDTSSIQSRAPEAKGTAIKELTWPDGFGTQFTTLLNIRGKDYLLVSDELGAGNCDDPAKPPFGSARIFDVSDERNPQLVSKFMTEALEPSHCQEALEKQGGIGISFGVGTHYCSVDRTTDPRLLGCGFWEGGLRVFDIRNPWRPKEVAYFDTGSGSVPGLPHFRPDRREVWVAVGNADSNFYVLRFPKDGVVDEILRDE